jgi:hypothetical protein
MAFVWAVGAFPVMVSAFLMDDFCTANNKIVDGNETSLAKCSPQKGTVTEEARILIEINFN